MNVVDSPPGTTSPSSPLSCSGLRTSTGSAPSRRSIAACSRKFPCRARTPILMRRILDFGDRRPGPPGKDDRDPDEDETPHRERDGAGPLVGTALAGTLEETREAEERE